MRNRGALVELLLGMIGGGGFSAFVGCYLLWQGWQNLRNGSVPLAGKMQLTGCAGRLGALVLMTFGVAAIATGAILALLCLIRLPSLMAGE
jgi:hypothetical protein